MDFWNTKDLSIPPINTYKTVNKNIDIKYLSNVLKEGKKFFESDKYMQADFLVLSRIVYRMKQKFRTAKDFKSLEKLSKALENYFKMDISSQLDIFQDLMPAEYTNETYLPTKNLMDYILVRLQGLVKLMERIVETSKIAAYLLDKRIHTGHFWKIATISLALASRVYILARYIVNFTCNFYRKLFPFSAQLQNIKGNWLPHNYVLPPDLKDWLSVDWLEYDDEVQIIEVPTEIPDIIKFFDLVKDEDEDVQFCEEYFMVDDDEDDDIQIVNDFKKLKKIGKETSFVRKLGEMRGFDTEEDAGEIINIDDSFQEPNVDVIEIEDSYLVSDNTIESDIINTVKNNSSTISIDDSYEEESMKEEQGRDLLETKENIIESDMSIMEVTDDVRCKLSNLPENLTEPYSNKIKKEHIRMNHSISNGFVSDTNHSKLIKEENVILIPDDSIMEIDKVKIKELKNDYVEDKSELKKDIFSNMLVKMRSTSVDSNSNLDDDKSIIMIPDTPQVNAKFKQFDNGKKAKNKKRSAKLKEKVLKKKMALKKCRYDQVELNKADFDSVPLSSTNRQTNKIFDSVDKKLLVKRKMKRKQNTKESADTFARNNIVLGESLHNVHKNTTRKKKKKTENGTAVNMVIKELKGIKRKLSELQKVHNKKNMNGNAARKRRSTSNDTGIKINKSKKRKREIPNVGLDKFDGIGNSSAGNKNKGNLKHQSNLPRTPSEGRGKGKSKKTNPNKSELKHNQSLGRSVRNNKISDKVPPKIISNINRAKKQRRKKRNLKKKLKQSDPKFLESTFAIANKNKNRNADHHKLRNPKQFNQKVKKGKGKRRERYYA